MFNDFEIEYEKPGGDSRRLLLNARRVVIEEPDSMILLAIEDITARVQAEGAEVAHAELERRARNRCMNRDGPFPSVSRSEGPARVIEGLLKQYR
jgi:hypothetical protein